MSTKAGEPFRTIGSTPTIHRYNFGTIALSPVAPLVVESGFGDFEFFLRITNYETQEILGQVPIADEPGEPYDLSFSPDGRLLLAMHGEPGPWNDLVIYSEPWVNPREIHRYTFHTFFYGVWLDERTVLAAGTVGSYEPCIKALLESAGERFVACEVLEGRRERPRRRKVLWIPGSPPVKTPTLGPTYPCIALLDVERRGSQLLLLKELQPSSTSGEHRVRSAFCSSSGLAAFFIGEDQVATYRLDKDRKQVFQEGSFPVRHHSSVFREVAVAEDGQTILVFDSGFSHRPVLYYDRQGKLLQELTHTGDRVFFRHETIAILERLDKRQYKLALYQIGDGSLDFWCSRNFGSECRAFDLVTRDEKTIVAVAEEDHTTVFEIEDFDVLQLASLASDDPDQRRRAARNLGVRRYRPGVAALTHLIRDDTADVQLVAVEALAEIGAPEALPHLIGALGGGPDDGLETQLWEALRRFSKRELVPAVFDCLKRPSVAHRRGAVRVLEDIPSIEAIDELCTVLSDADTEIRLSAARALGKREDTRAAVVLLEHLNDKDEQVRLAVQQATLSILDAAGMLSSQVSKQLSVPLDVVGYADKVISTGCMRHFEDFGDPVVGQFLSSLASASVGSNQPLPEILNAIESLTVPGGAAKRASAAIALTVALIFADTMRKKQRWQEAVNIFHNAVRLARQVDAPQIEWRTWYAIGECSEALGTDQKALDAFRNAMGVIDRLWFALLEEDKLRDFFQDKALLYDRAGLCALRLGHDALALEIGEKAKTRYLGDLIARRQMDPQVVLHKELRRFWAILDQARSVRVPLAQSEPQHRQRVEIVAAESVDEPLPGATVKPERLAALQESSESSEELRANLHMVENIWQLVAYATTSEDERVRQYLEEIYQALASVRQVADPGSLPLRPAERDQYVAQYKQAADALRDLNSERLWAFVEYGSDWIEEIADATATRWQDLVLEAVMEALNSVLHHEPVFGVPEESAEGNGTGLSFATRVLEAPSTSLSQQTTVIESALERQSQTRWRYITRLARGEISCYRDVANSLDLQPQLAHVQFSVTDQGTVVYVVHGVEGKPQQNGLLPKLHGEDGLRVFTFPKVTLSLLRQHLVEGEDSWFARYQAKQQSEGMRAWQQAMDRTLRWIYEAMVAELDAHFKRMDVKRLRIIPHRALHLIPFSALYYEDTGGQRHYLIDDYVIEYAPSATLQQICRERARDRTFLHGLTAIANPTGDLPFSAAEVERVLTYFSDSPVKVWRGDDARREKLMASTPGSVLHFAGHGSYNWDDPLASHLLFARNEPLQLAHLFAEQVQLPETRLVVLSACETNVTDPKDLADEYLGLASGFLFAGTPAVIGTLWAVDDPSTALLMGRFYQKHLKKGLPPSEALRAAQCWLRQATVADLNLVDYYERLYQASEKQDEEAFIKKRYYKAKENCRPFSHPYYWAACIVSGAGL